MKSREHSGGESGKGISRIRGKAGYSGSEDGAGRQGKANRPTAGRAIPDSADPARQAEVRAGLPGISVAAPQRSLGTLAISVLLHAGIAVVAVLWVVREIWTPAPAAAFEPPEKVVMLPVRLREQALSQAKHDASAPRPAATARMTSKAPSPLVLPALPVVDLKQMLTPDPSALVSGSLTDLMGSGGFGQGTGRGMGGGGGTGNGSGMTFFQIRDTARSIVILIDVSQSMFTRTGDYDAGSRRLIRHGADQSFHTVRLEALKLIDSLGPDSRFGVVRWSGSARSWRPELVRATEPNKAAAREHILQEVDANSAPPSGGRPGGTRHDYALEELLRLGPESAFMLTDGNATRSLPGGGTVPIPGEELVGALKQAAQSGQRLPRIHTIYYLTGTHRPEEETMLKNIARTTRGKFRKVDAGSPSGSAAKSNRRAGGVDRGSEKPQEPGKQR